MKGKINHIKILFCAILLLFVTSLLLTQNRVMAEDENPNLNLITNLRSAKDVVDKAAKYHLLGTAMWECQSWVRGHKVRGEENDTGVFQERKDNGHFFYYNLDDIEYFWFGPFLEEAATGEFQDGAFACKEGIAYEDWPDSGGILDYFARQTQDDETYKDEGIQAVICNQWRRSVAGWLQSITTINEPYRGLDCIDVFDDRGENGKDLVFYTYDEDNQTLNFHPGNINGEDTPQESIDWINNLEGIHRYKSGNGYMEDYWQYFRLHDQVKADKYDSNLQPANELIPIWGDQLDLDRLNGKNDKSQLNKAKRHYIYRKDFDTACAPKATAISDDNYRDGDPLEGDNIMWLKAMNYNKEDSIKGTQRLEGFTTNGWYTGIPPLKVLTDDKLNCWDLAERVNETYEAYNKEIAKIAEDDCNKNDEINKVWNFVKAKSDIIVKQYKDPKSVTPVAIGINGEQYDPAKLTPEQIEGAQKRNMFWVNYEEVEDENGKVSYNLLTFTAEELNKAQTDLTAYNLYGNNHHFHLIDGNDLTKGFSCEVPEGYDVGTIGHTYSDSDDPEAGDSDPCYDAGVEGMSWVLCPAINNTSNTVDAIEKLLRKWLTIPVEGEDGIYAQAKDSNGKEQEGTYVGWDIFRNIANVLLAILFLFIIFSQLTGYGIDNYGIKKMLPKLIAMAIIINLSYILCKIAVDVSNILGVGLNNLFETIGRGIASAGQKDMNYTTSTIVGVLFGAIAGTSVVAGIALSAAGGGWVMVVVVLVLALLVALVGVLIFFVMLSVRIIIVAVFIVLAPLALACYILPNTKSLFQKWWKVFEAALLVFPICGALYGASFIVKAIVGGDGAAGSWTFMGAIAAVIAPFLPFFALPSLLKGALAGLTAVGGALSSIGNGIKKGAQSSKDAIKNSEAYKNSQERKAQNTYNKLSGKLAKGKNLTASQRRKYLRTGAIAQKAQKDAESVYKGNFDTQDRSKVTESLKESLLGNDAQKAGAAFDSLLAQGGIDEALGALEGADWGAMRPEVRDRLLRSMSGSNVDAMKAFAKYRGSGGTAGFNNWVNNTRTEEEKRTDASKGAKVQSYAQHLRENGEHAMDGYSKDEAQFVASHMAGIQGGMGASFQKDFGAMLGSAGLNSKDAKAQSVWDDLITKQLGSGTSTITAGDLGIVANSFGTMREGMSHAIVEGIKNDISSYTGAAATRDEVMDEIKSQLGSQIQAARDSSLINDSIKSGVRQDFGI